MEMKSFAWSLSVALNLMCMVPDCSSKLRVVDLTHSFNEKSHRWPTNPPYQFHVDIDAHKVNSKNETYYYNSNTVKLSEHTGTHLDAPKHFSDAPGTWSTSDIPVERLVAPVAHLNLRAQAASDRDYLVSAEDIMNHETKYGCIEAGSVVLLDFGWAKYWNNYTAYFGTETNDTTSLHFPGLSLEAAELVAERGVFGVGLDTPSMDYGQSSDFDAHNYLLGQNIYFLENVADMSDLPYGNSGITLIAGVMKIDSGSGGPVRLIALLHDGMNPFSEPQVAIHRDDL